MKYVRKISLLISCMVAIGLTAEGFAMAKRYTHFVDSNYEGTVIKSQPNGQKGTRWWHEDADFHVIVNYPADHRTDWPLKEWMGVQVSSNPPKIGKFRILKWQLIDQDGRQIPVKFEAKNLGNPWDYEFDTNAYPIAFFTEIPKNVENLKLEFKLEIKIQDAQTKIVKESIPLKRSHFEVGLFEKDKYQ